MPATSICAVLSLLGLSSALSPDIVRRQTVPDGTPPTSDPLPSRFTCGEPYLRATCPTIGLGIDQLPTVGLVTLPGGAGCREITCAENVANTLQLTWCTDNPIDVTIEWFRLRERFADVGALCSGTQTDPSDCQGQVFYEDGTNIIATENCGDNPPL